MGEWFEQKPGWLRREIASAKRVMAAWEVAADKDAREPSRATPQTQQETE